MKTMTLEERVKEIIDDLKRYPPNMRFMDYCPEKENESWLGEMIFDCDGFFYDIDF